MVNSWKIQIFSFWNSSLVSSTLKLPHFHENQRDPAGSKRALMINLWKNQIFLFWNSSRVSSTLKLPHFHENQRDHAGSKGALTSIYTNFKNMEETMVDKCYKYIERSHSGMTDEPFFQHKPNCLLRSCLHGLLRNELL